MLKKIDFSYQFRNSFSDSWDVKRDTVNSPTISDYKKFC